MYYGISLGCWGVRRGVSGRNGRFVDFYFISFYCIVVEFFFFEVVFIFFFDVDIVVIGEFFFVNSIVFVFNVFYGSIFISISGFVNVSSFFC